MEWLEEVNQMLNELFIQQRRRGGKRLEELYEEVFPLHGPVVRGAPYTFIQSLLDVGWPVEKYDWFCCTPLTYAVIKCLHHAVSSKKGRFVEYNNSLKIVKALRKKINIATEIMGEELKDWI